MDLNIINKILKSIELNITSESTNSSINISNDGNQLSVKIVDNKFTNSKINLSYNINNLKTNVPKEILDRYIDVLINDNEDIESLEEIYNGLSQEDRIYIEKQIIKRNNN
ncbi:hypothetical protein FPHOBKDP_00177 [Listeria phage LPJP1]|nr:hypothetical protein FPHOBKDP_00177 [Listeria phage LPJP1]